MDERTNAAIKSSASSTLASAEMNSYPQEVTEPNSAVTGVLNERLSSATKLFGRDQEQGEILSIYHRFSERAAACSGLSKTEFILIEGAPGTGAYDGEDI